MSDKISGTDEKQFIYHDSFNKGHILTPSMVENCIGLSNHAKTVYSNILNHVYEKGHSAFPSTYKLALSCSCTVNSVVNYVNELVEKEFIDKESRGRGRSNHYFIRDCKDVPLLHVSEMFWSVMSKLTHVYSWKKLLPAKEQIISFMETVGYPIQYMDTSDSAKEELSSLLKHVLKGGKIEVGMLPKNMKFQKPKVVEPTPVAAVVKTSKDGTDKPNREISIGTDKNHWSLLGVDEWKVTQFKEYFYDKYLDTVGQPHPRNMKKHTGLMRRVLDNLQRDKHLLKRYIDVSFEIGYDNMTLDYFSTANRIGEIQTYISSGKRPFYLKDKRVKAVDVIPESQKTNLSSKELFDKVLGGKE